MITSASVSEILWMVLPLECELVGDRNIAAAAKTVADGREVPNPSPTPDGYKMEPYAALVAVAAAANFVKTCVDIYLALAKAKGAQPREDEFVPEAVKQGSSLVESAAKLASAVFKALSSG